MATKKAKSISASAPSSAGPRGFFSDNLFIILAFVVPFVLMTTAFAIMKVSPFGDKQILVTDAWNQYYPFLVDFQDKLKNGESLFWSWSQGAGVNYFALMAYYLASPLNFLSVFIPTAWLREFLMFTVSIRIACAGMFTAIFLRSVYKRNDFSLVIFGCCFSFCAFFMGYYWNTIWLDAVCITPLVVLGTVKLLTENKFRLYTITLALSLLTNFYIGLFTCIFVFLTFLAYHIVKWEGYKPFLKKLSVTAAFSAIAIGITAFFLLPAYFALGNTHASTSTFPKNFSIYIGGTNDLVGMLTAMQKILSNFLTFIKPNTIKGILPNIACGTVSVVLGILFFTNKKISLREKVVDLCLIAFMLLSCIIKQLDYIWHGFHFTNNIPYRFSYLVSFVLVVMAYRAFMLIEHNSVWNILIASVLTALIIILGIGTQENGVLIGTSIIAAIICLMLFLCVKRKISQKVLLIALAVVIIGESGATAYIGVKTTRVTTKNQYPLGGEVTADIIDHMNTLEQDTPELWRAEVTSYQTYNDSSLNGYNGLSIFNSMANESTTQFFENLGMKGRKSGNRYGYAESSPVINTFMNLKYLISRTGNYGNTYDLTEVYENQNEKLLLNEHYIPMGFMVNSALSDWVEGTEMYQYNPFDKQNEFFSLATGIEENVYSHLEVVNQGHTDYSVFPVHRTDYGKYSFTCNDKTVTPHVKWNYEAPQDGLYFMFAAIDGGSNVTFMINDVAQPTPYNIILPCIGCIGECHAGDKISIYSELNQGSSGNARVYVNLLNEDIFERGYENISKDVMTTTHYTGTSMEGIIDVSESGLFYTSIPYEEGWTAVVDGNEVDIEPVGGSMIAFPLSEGSHSIKLHYSPKGFWAGLAVSVICLAAFVAACIKMYGKSKGKKEQPALSKKG